MQRGWQRGAAFAGVLAALAFISGAVQAETAGSCFASGFPGVTADGLRASHTTGDLASCTAATPLLLAQAKEQSTGIDAQAASATELAKQLQNPIGNLYSFPFQNNTNFGYGPHDGTQNILNIQPVIPIHLDADWNVITRTILPVIWTPDVSPAPSEPVGLGPTTFSAFLSPAKPSNGWLWGVGPIVQIPTVTSSTLGSNVWGAGPTGVLVYMGGPIVAGALANNIWSLGGTDGGASARYNNFLAQPFFNFNFGDGWYVGTSPIVTANWRASDEKWTVPIGGDVGRVVRLGKLPINLLAGAYYNAVKPTDAADWQLRTQFTLIF